MPAGGTEYAVVKGDILAKIAKDHHVTVKAITDANPGIEPSKLKIGQKIHIPAPSASGATTPTAAPTMDPASPGGEQVYTVKSGDNLTKVASHHGVSVKALRAANSLKTDSIKVGQKLKIPAKGSAATSVPTAPAESAPGGGTSMPAGTSTGR
jgi:LysM repeat protein